MITKPIFVTSVIIIILSVVKGVPLYKRSPKRRDWGMFFPMGMGGPPFMGMPGSYMGMNPGIYGGMNPFSGINPGTTFNPSATNNPGTTFNPSAANNPGTIFNPSAANNPGTIFNPSAANNPGTTFNPSAANSPGINPTVNPAMINQGSNPSTSIGTTNMPSSNPNGNFGNSGFSNGASSFQLNGFNPRNSGFKVGMPNSFPQNTNTQQSNYGFPINPNQILNRMY
jgi:hypothetical protein